MFQPGFEPESIGRVEEEATLVAIVRGSADGKGIKKRARHAREISGDSGGLIEKEELTTDYE